MVSKLLLYCCKVNDQGYLWLLKVYVLFQFSCLADKMAYMKYAKEHKDMEHVNFKESLGMAISMADSCSMIKKDMATKEMGPKGMRHEEAPEVKFIFTEKESSL